MKITLYELLGLIKEGKAPKKIKVNGNLYEFHNGLNSYITALEHSGYKVSLDAVKGDINLIANAFNEIIEIIEEEKEIEKLGYCCVNTNGEPRNFVDVEEVLKNKINELIDVINDMRDKE